MKMTYYITHKGTAYKANKMPELVDYCVDRYTLRLHIFNEKASMKMNKFHKPQPIIFRLSEDEMNDLISVVKKKIKGFNEDHVALRVQSNNVPVVLIVKEDVNGK